MSDTRGANFISTARDATTEFWKAYQVMLSLQQEWNAQDYSNNLEDGVDGNSGVLAADVGAVIFATADAVKVLMDAGHSTNVTKLLA